MAQTYYIVKIALDNFRFALMKNALSKIGFAPELKILWLVRPSDIIKCSRSSAKGDGTAGGGGESGSTDRRDRRHGKRGGSAPAFERVEKRGAD